MQASLAAGNSQEALGGLVDLLQGQAQARLDAAALEILQDLGH